MLQSLGYAARRREALRQSCPVLHLTLLPAAYPGGQPAAAACDLAADSPTSPSLMDAQQAPASRWAPAACRWRHDPTSLHHLLTAPSSAASPPTRASPSSIPKPFVMPPFSAPLTRKPGEQERTHLEAAAPITASAAAGPHLFFPPWQHSPWQHQQTRLASSSSAAARAKGRGSGGKAAAAPPRVRTPDWARMPLQLDAVQAVMRRRGARLMTLHRQLAAEVTVAEAGGWSAAGKLKEAEAAVAALPIPPKDAGESELTEATAPGTSFDAAHAAMKELCRRGVHLVPERHLAPLLHKASSSGQLSAALGLLRTNHLVQAATRLGAHEAAHGGLYGGLVEECQRLRTTAPLLELWDSLYEYGMEPSREAAQAAVQVALSLRDGPAAAALVSLSSQYGSGEPLAAAEVPAVLRLLDSDHPEEAARLRQLLPRLGVPGSSGTA